MREGLSRAALPLWARLLDAGVLAALVVAAAVIWSGGFFVFFGPIRFSSHSILRPLLIAAVLATVRHVRWPADPLPSRISHWLGRSSTEPRRSITAIALFSRVAALMVGYFAVLTVGVAEPGFRVSPDPLIDLPARFDAGWYSGIALNGYDFDGRFDRHQSIAFFPALPLLMRTGGYVTGAFVRAITPERRTARLLWAGTIISFAAFLWGVLFLHRLAVEMIGDERAVTATGLLAAYPFAVFFSVPYTESLFLLGSVAAFYRFRRREWGHAAAWGLLVGLTRPNGCLLSVVLALILLEHVWQGPRTLAWLREYRIVAALLAAAMPGLGMLAYSAHVRYLTGAWFGWVYVQRAWGRGVGAPSLDLLGQWITLGLLPDAVGQAPFDALNAFGLFFALAMLWAAFRYVGLAGGAFVLLNLVPPFFSGGVLSLGRMSSTMFPLFLGLAAILPRGLILPVIAAFGICQGLIAVLFFTWRPIF